MKGLEALKKFWKAFQRDLKRDLKNKKGFKRDFKNLIINCYTVLGKV